MKISKRSITCLFIILLVSILYLATIRSGQPWGDDFAMYILETRNIANGTTLAETGYIYNPLRPSVGPKVYPPVLPVLLLPGYLLGSINDLTPMKIEMVAFFIWVLVLVWWGLGRRLPGFLSPVFLAILGFNPVLWNFKEVICSDIPFTFLLYLTLVLVDKGVGDSRVVDQNHWRVVAIGALVYLCYGTRAIGIVLVPALILLAVIYWKRGGQSMAWAAGLGLIPCLIQQRFLGGNTNYGNEFRFSLQAVIQNISTYSWSLATFWANPYSHGVRNLLFVAATLLALVAYIRRIWSSPSIYEIFLPLYLGVVLLWPNPAGFRYLIPITPIYVFYVLEGVHNLPRFRRVPLRELTIVLLLVLIGVSYVAEFTHENFGAFQEGVSRKESIELFSFIQSHTAANDIFIFRKPRALALYTGRRASSYPEAETAAGFCSYFDTIRATYLIEAAALDDRNFENFVHKEFRTKEPAFTNADFRVLRLLPSDIEKCRDGEIAYPGP
jgi:hypothetical protein